MLEFRSPSAAVLAPIPDDLTIPQFFLDRTHPSRPAADPRVPAIIEDATGRAISFAELRSRTHGLANSLRTRYSIHEEDVVAVYSPNHVDYSVATWAVHRLGAVVSGANPGYTVEELVYQLTTAQVTLLIAHPACLESAISAAKEVGLSADRILLFDVEGVTLANPQISTINALVKAGLAAPASFTERALEPGEAKTKVAFLNFSSGTTGKPKAVAIPHISIISNVIQMAVHNRLAEEWTSFENRRFRVGDVCIGILPFFHIYGLVVNLHFILYAGMSLVVVPKFNFESMLASIVRYRINHLMLVPPQAVLLCKHPKVANYDLSHIRVFMFGAAPLSKEVNDQLVAKFPGAVVGQGYGLTETATTISFVNLFRQNSMSAGQLLPGIVARVVKPDGSLAGHGEPGELHVTGPSMALRYSNNEQATKETFINGWVRTGDEVIIDKDGELYIVDRLKEIMKVRGFQVAPAELEGCLLDHVSVSDACVVGVPDEYSGEVPFAFVSLKEEALELVKDPIEAERLKRSIKKHVAAHKVPYKHLAAVEFVDLIPKNPSGKLLRRLMRDQARALKAAEVKAKL